MTRFDPRGLALAERHYTRQQPGSDQWLRPGSDVVLITAEGSACWASLRPRFAQHAWAGAWENPLFRNEARELYLSSDLILEAVSLTRAFWGDPPALGMVTFVDMGAVRRKRDPGRCYRRAGFEPVGYTQERGRLALQLLPERMPAAPWSQLDLEAA